MPLIFISHAQADKPVVDDLFDLLQTGCDVRREEIVCTSVDGAEIRTGDDFIEWIREKIQVSNLIILFITPNYFASHFCVAEMGAAWALQKEVFPLVAPTIERDLGGVMLGRQTSIVDETGLDHLRDRVALHYPAAAQATARWSLKKDEFLVKFRTKLSKLPSPPVVDRSQLEHEKERTSEAMRMNQQLTDENKRLHEHIALLEKTKDRSDVEGIRAKFFPEEERYSNLVKEVSDQLMKLSKIEVRFVYSSVRNETWIPGRDCIEEYRMDIERAKQSYWILVWESGESASITANREHPRLRKVFQSIKELEDFIRLELSAEARTRME
jgi:hypothetical protein